MSKEGIRERSRRLCRVVTVLSIGTGVLILLERFSASGIDLVNSGFAPPAIRRFGCQAVSACPEFMFLSGLASIRATLQAFARGDLFVPAISRMLERIGILLASGAAVRILAVPGLCRLLGFSPGYWIAFDASAMTLAALGLSLTAISGVLRQASAVQAELDEIF